MMGEISEFICRNYRHFNAAALATRLKLTDATSTMAGRCS